MWEINKEFFSHVSMCICCRSFIAITTDKCRNNIVLPFNAHTWDTSSHWIDADMESKDEIKVKCELGFRNVNISISDIYQQLGKFHGGNVFHQIYIYSGVGSFRRRKSQSSGDPESMCQVILIASHNHCLKLLLCMLHQ